MHLISPHLAHEVGEVNKDQPFLLWSASDPSGSLQVPSVPSMRPSSFILSWDPHSYGTLFLMSVDWSRHLHCTSTASGYLQKPWLAGYLGSGIWYLYLPHHLSDSLPAYLLVPSLNTQLTYFHHTSISLHQHNCIASAQLHLAAHVSLWYRAPGDPAMLFVKPVSFASPLSTPSL